MTVITLLPIRSIDRHVIPKWKVAAKNKRLSKDIA